MAIILLHWFEKYIMLLLKKLHQDGGGVLNAYIYYRSNIDASTL